MRITQALVEIEYHICFKGQQRGESDSRKQHDKENKPVFAAPD